MRHRLRNQSGSGLVETLIAVVLLSLVLASMVGVLLQQQRFYMVTGDVANTASVLQRVETALTTELMPLNPELGDVRYADPDSFESRVFRGVYALCDKQLSTDVIVTVRSLTGGPPLSTDSALVYSHGQKATAADDHWKPVLVASVTGDTCPDGTPGWTGVVADLNGVLDEIPLGAPVRVFHWGSYWLTPESGSWFLKTDALSGAPMVVSGPLASADSAASSVLRFSYLDVASNPAATLGEIERVAIDISAVGVVPKRRGGTPVSKERTLLVKLRNAAQ